ncbi:hypothetical protein IAU60_001046 [Kwoniella sp. DSM 27419]
MISIIALLTSLLSLSGASAAPATGTDHADSSRDLPFAHIDVLPHQAVLVMDNYGLQPYWAGQSAEFNFASPTNRYPDKIRFQWDVMDESDAVVWRSDCYLRPNFNFTGGPTCTLSSDGRDGEPRGHCSGDHDADIVITCPDAKCVKPEACDMASRPQWGLL